MFWHRWSLASNDRIYVEVSPDFGATWITLKRNPADVGAPSYLEQGTIATDFRQEVLSLYHPNQNYFGEQLFVRFRLETDSSSTEDGWYIDDIEFRNRPNDNVIYPVPAWCENVEGDLSVNNWVTEGNWARSSERTYQGSFAFSDSPGQNYQNNSNSSLILGRRVNLAGLGANAMPVLEFWHQWHLERVDSLNIDVSLDDGATWQPTPLWSHTFTETNGGNKPADYPASVANERWNQQQRWQRTVVYLLDLKEEGNLRFRFRLDARNHSDTGGGWWIDNLCIRLLDEPTIGFPSSQDLVNSAAVNNWHLGPWGPVTDSGRTVFNESPSGNNTNWSDSILELRPSINLTGITAAQQPTLYYWEKARLRDSQRIYVEVLPVNGDGIPVNSSGQIIDNPRWELISSHNTDYRNDAYVRRQFDLSRYLNTTQYPGGYLRLRFRLQHMNSDGDTADGWMIDDVQLRLRNGTFAQGGVPTFGDGFTEAANGGAPDWVREGSWSVVNAQREFGTGSAFPPGTWNAYYYNLDWSASNRRGVLWGSEAIVASDLNFDWGTCCAPQIVLDNNDDSDRDSAYVAVYERQIAVFSSEGLEVKFTGSSEDEFRVVVTNSLGASVIQNWTKNATFTYAFPVGISTLSVEWIDSYDHNRLSMTFENARLQADILADGAWEATYFRACPNYTAQPPAWNADDPERHPVVDFSWTNTAPSVVMNSNFEVGGLLTSAGLGTNTDPFQINSEGYFYFEAEGNEDNPSDALLQSIANESVAVSGQFDYWAFQNQTQTRAAHTSTPNQHQGFPGFDSDRANFTGTGYMLSSARNSGFNPAEAVNHGLRLDYRFAVPAGQGGTWYVAVRYATGNQTISSRNTLFFGLDGQVALSDQTFSTTNTDRNSNLVDDSNSEAFRWFGNWNNSGSNDMRLNLTGGQTYTLNIWPSEPGVAVDAIWIGRDPRSNVNNPATSNTSCTYPANRYEQWIAEYSRLISVSDATTVTFNVQSDDGHRVYVDGVLQSTGNKWNSGSQTSSVPVTMTPLGSPYEIVVQYRAGGSPNFIRISPAIQSPAFHTDNNPAETTNADQFNTNYPRFSGYSLILQGDFELQPGTAPLITWWQRYQLHGTDAIVVEVSQNGGYDAMQGEGSQWIEVFRATGSRNTWHRRVVDLVAVLEALGETSITQLRNVTVRFRIDALRDSDSNPGWFIDDIALTD
ncbi:MAG: hypothetical protein HC915_03105 [Anaerolineae bacterium]|nr:hypothetical protein [Anaerolineae bacterium]